MEKIKITNPNEFQKLMEKLEKNPSLARGFCKGAAPNIFRDQWESIATALNALGPPPIRTSDGWQRQNLAGLEVQCKVKYGCNKKVEYKAAGGGIFKQLILRACGKFAPIPERDKSWGYDPRFPNIEGKLPQIEDNVDFNLIKSLEMERSPCRSSRAVTKITPILKRKEEIV